MSLRRPKSPAIYDIVGDWWDNSHGVPYIAHAIFTEGAPLTLGPVTQGTGNQNLATNHPDQSFWKDNKNGIRDKLDREFRQGRLLRRIEVDCALMPCVQQGGCVYRVPALIRSCHDKLADVELRIFSHRDENMGGGNGNDSSKRYYIARTSDGNDLTNYNAHDGWGWVPFGGDADYLNSRRIN
ncbi:MAG: hypothetical protein R3208_02170 [Ketobacteraceae bacterium]|nr:hypothetical protein [Ketobacteraceae bacterium]